MARDIFTPLPRPTTIFTARLGRDLIDRLHDTAARYDITISEISRRAAAYYYRQGLIRVVSLPKRQTTTREESLPMQFDLDFSLGITTTNIAQVLEWYLAAKDTGGRNQRY